MRFIIAGGRYFDDPDMLLFAMETVTRGLVLTVEEVVSGGQQTRAWKDDEWRYFGADYLGEQWARARDIPVSVFEADWDTHGKWAGPKRNKEMAEYAEAGDDGGCLVAFWDGKSRGTRSMIKLALEQGLEVHVFRYGAA